MKNVILTIFKISIALVLAGKVLNWLLHFSDATNQLLNMVMFSIIGITYIVMGYYWNHKLLKIVITTCGVFLIAMNFLPGSTPLEIVGIVCILAPMLIARFYKEENATINTIRS